jgi:hypothetical protein
MANFCINPLRNWSLLHPEKGREIVHRVAGREVDRTGSGSRPRIRSEIKGITPSCSTATKFND